jgi:peptide/nickel transport system substrate-binding protein
MSIPDPHPYVSTLVKQLKDAEVPRREFLRTASLLGVSASAAYLLAGLANPVQAQTNKPRGGTLRLSTTVYDVKSPATATTTAHPMIYSQVVEYLTSTGIDNVTRGQLLQSWQPSADLKTWTLKVRPGVKWHSGRAFVAADVAWNLRRLLSDAVGSSVLGLMSGYMLNAIDTGQLNDKGRKIIRHELWTPNAIEVVDSLTVRLNLKSPQLAVPEHLGHFPAVMLYPEENGVFGPGSVGTGAFKLVEIQPGRRAVIEAVKGYWGEGPWLDRVEFIDVGGTEAAIANALVSKQVDGAFQVLPDSFPVLKAQAHLKYYEATTADTVTTRMNVRNKPFDDARVRKAFRLAVDTQKVSELTFGQFASPAEHHHVSPIHPEYAKLPPFNRDVDQAKRLLAQAGYPSGVDVEIVIQQNPPHHLRHATALQSMWKDAGIRATIKTVPNPQYWDVWLTAPLGSTVWAHRSLGVMNLSLAYRSGVAWNESAYANPAFDKLLDEAEGVPDPKARSLKMAGLQRIMQEDGPVVQTYWRKLFTFYDKRVVGFEMHPEYQVNCNELALQPA